MFQDSTLEFVFNDLRFLFVLSRTLVYSVLLNLLFSETIVCFRGLFRLPVVTTTPPCFSAGPLRSLCIWVWGCVLALGCESDVTRLRVAQRDCTEVLRQSGGSQRWEHSFLLLSLLRSAPLPAPDGPPPPGCVPAFPSCLPFIFIFGYWVEFRSPG